MHNFFATSPSFSASFSRIDHFWDIQNDDHSPTHELFLPDYTDKTTTGRRDVRSLVKAACIQTRNFHKGHRYKVPKGAFHSSGIPANVLTVTLIRKSNIDRDGVPQILLPLENQGSVGEPVKEPNQHVAWHAIDQAISSIDE